MGTFSHSLCSHCSQFSWHKQSSQLSSKPSLQMFKNLFWKFQNVFEVLMLKITFFLQHCCHDPNSRIDNVKVSVQLEERSSIRMFGKLKKAWNFVFQDSNSLQPHSLVPSFSTNYSLIPWIDLEDMMLNEISQIRKDKYCIISLLGGI